MCHSYPQIINQQMNIQKVLNWERSSRTKNDWMDRCIFMYYKNKKPKELYNRQNKNFFMKKKKISSEQNLLGTSI